MLKYFNDFYLRQSFRTNILSIFLNPFFFYRKGLYKEVEALAPDLRGKILDFGCGSKPYKSLFANATSYIGVDLENPGHDHSKEQIDIYYDGNVIPVENESFDGVFCSEVLEHVPDLDQSINEIKRILKLNGKLLLTVPFVWGEHELPHDYRRFTKVGIENLLISNGFEIIHSRKVSNHIESLFQLFNLYLYNFFGSNKYLKMILTFIFLTPFTIFGILLSMLLPTKKGLYLGTVILAKSK